MDFTVEAGKSLEFGEVSPTTPYQYDDGEPPAVVNPAPVADAGTDQNVVTGTLVTLNGSASSDANGDSLTYAWTLTSKPEGSAATLSVATSVQPKFTADVDGSYTATLVVSDGQVSSDSASVLITAASDNSAPVANAGSDQNVLTGSSVTLDGSLSSDADGDSLTYAWTLISKPEGSAAILIGANSANSKFITDIDGVYIFSLVVSDGQVSSTADSVTVNSTTSNAAPVADAGPDQNVITGIATTLDGTASSDANGDTLTYLWSINSWPAGSIGGGQATDPIITFTADVDGTYVISLVVNDGLLSSDPAIITITATTTNAAPVAFAGYNQVVFTNSEVTLDGSGSSDANGDPLTYSWTLISQPTGSGVVSLSDPTNVAPTFTPPVAGTYVLALVVNDGSVNSDPHTVVVTAEDITPPTIVYHYLYGGQGYAIYLGCLNCNSLSSESVCNDFGSYGSSFALNSIWNQFGNYGSQFSLYSPWNSYSISGPAIIGSDGLFYGYFTTNSFRFNRTLNSDYLNVLNYFSATSDLSATRIFACGS